MKQGMVWLFMLLKRQMKKISLYVILLGIAGSTFFIRHIAVNFSVNISIGVMNEGDEEAEGKENAADMAQRVLKLMTGHKGLVKFVEYDNEEEMKQDVRTSDIYAGYIFMQNFGKDVGKEELEDSVKVISTEDSIVSKITNELVFSFVMQEYTYALLFYDTCETGYFDEFDEEQIAEDLRKFYEENRTNGSTFSVAYSGVKEQSSRMETDVFDYISPMIHGVIGVLIFLSGLCGTLILYKDRECGTFARFTTIQTIAVSFAEILIPVFLTGMTGMVCLIFSGMYQEISQGMMGQWGHMFFHIILVSLYCLILSGIIRNRTVFQAAVPVFLMASLLFCHVFINLNTIVPQFKFISLLLPPNYF